MVYKKNIKILGKEIRRQKKVIAKFTRENHTLKKENEALISDNEDYVYSFMEKI